MFRAALVKLTLLYLLIIMVISLFFSTIIYNVSALEIAKNAGRQQNAVERLGRGNMMNSPELLAERERLVDEANQNILNNLLYINLAILVLGGGLCYYLAGRTLRPIEEAHDAQSRFTSDASHELRSPLAAMKAEIEIALRNPKLSKTEAVALLTSNLEEVERLTALSDGLLALARNEAKPLAKKLLDANTLVANAIKVVAPLAKKNSHIVHFTPVEGLTVFGDEGTVTELMVIVLDNAIKYSETGKQTTITVSKRSKYTYFRVQDEGIGIDKDDLAHIFDRFYRADQSRTKNMQTGYGLGLALAREITVANGGSISVDSKKGAGSTFTIKLPSS